MENKPPNSGLVPPGPPVQQIDKKWTPRKFNGVAVYVHYPDFGELAPFLSEEGKQTFLDGLKSAMEYSLTAQAHWLVIVEDGSAILVFEEFKTNSHQKMMGLLECVFKDVRLWTGTFGKIGVPPMTFGFGAVAGEIQIQLAAPKLSGLAVDNATDLSKKFCSLFKVQSAFEADLARFAEHPQEWIDLDDIDMPATASGMKTQKRIFTKMIEREDPDDIALLKSARKAFFQKDYDDAHAKFDRLSRVKQFKNWSTIYLKRISAAKKPKI